MTYTRTAPGGLAGGPGGTPPHPPPSSSGLGRRPFKAVTRVRIPSGVRSQRSVHGPVAQLVSASPCQGEGRGFKSRQGRWPEESGARPGSSVGTSVRLKIGRSAVRPRPWPPQRSLAGQRFLAHVNSLRIAGNARLPFPLPFPFTAHLWKTPRGCGHAGCHSGESERGCPESPSSCHTQPVTPHRPPGLVGFFLRR